MIRIVDQQGDTVEAIIETGDVPVTVITSLRLDGDLLILYDFHIDGPGANRLGLTRLRALIDEVLEAYDVTRLEIRGFRRTTGWNPGRQPRPLRFRRRAGDA